MASRIEPLNRKGENPDLPERAVKRGRPPWADLAVLVSSGAFFTFFYRYPISSPDEGLIVTAAERIIRGQTPYRDFFSELAPGSFYLQAAVLHLGGRDLSCLRATVWVLGVVLTWLVYRLSRKLLDGPSSLLPPLVMAGICYSYNYTISHHWWSILFFMLMLLCIVADSGRAPPEKTGGRGLRLFVAGLLAAAALLCMQSLGFWAILTVVLWLLLVERLSARRSWRASLLWGVGAAFWFLVGAGVMTGLGVAYFWVHGALGAWIYDNFTFLFTNYWPYESWPNVYSWERFARLLRWLVREPSPRTFFYFGGWYFFSIVGPAAGFAGAIWQLIRRRGMERSRSRLLLLFFLTGIGSLLAELHCPDMAHLIWASPLILILFIDGWNEAIHKWSALRRPLVVGAGLAIALAVLGAYRRAAHVASWNALIQTRRGAFYADPESAAIFQQWINAIEQAVPPGGETFIFPYEAHLYYLTATRNPTPYDALLADFHSPEQFAETIALLWRQRPNYIFNCEPLERAFYRKRLPDDPNNTSERHPLEEVLHAGQTPYKLVVKVPGMEVWALKQ